MVHNGRSILKINHLWHLNFETSVKKKDFDIFFWCSCSNGHENVSGGIDCNQERRDRSLSLNSLELSTFVNSEDQIYIFKWFMCNMRYKVKTTVH